jgi:shikimate kinase
MINFNDKIEFLKSHINKPLMLVGLMGAGKSSIGRALADALQMQFVDADNLIVELEGRTIPEIFAQSGEAYFRKVEHQLMSELSQKHISYVVGTGGGAFMNDKTRALIKSKAISIFLHTEINVLAKRIGSGEGRPLLEGKNVHEALSALTEKRYPIYSKADISVESKDEEEQETLHRLINSLYTYLNA